MVGQGLGLRRVFARAAVPLARGAVIAFLVAATGCSTTGGLTKDSSAEAKRAAVTERVKGFWAARIEGNVNLAYTFMSPASREIVSLEVFRSQLRGTGFRDAKVETVECSDAACNVRLMVTYDHRLMKGIVTPLSEKWIIDEGQAWYVWGE